MNPNTSQFATVEPLESRLMMSVSATLSNYFSSAQELEIPISGTTALSAAVDSKDYNVYQVTMPANGKILLQMGSDDEAFRSHLKIYTETGRLIRSTSRRTSMTMKAGQTYYVFAGTKRGGGDYDLSLNTIPKDDIGNTTLATRTLKLSRASLLTRAVINYAGDVDVFKMLARHTGSVQVSAAPYGTLSGVDPRVSVIDAQGNVVSSGSEQGDANVLTLDVVAGQTYYFRASGAGITQGGYVLSLAKLAEDPPPVAPDVPVVPVGPEAPAEPLPAGVITGEILSTASGLQLLIRGTTGADTISLSQSLSGITLTTSTGTQVFSGSFASVCVYSFDGDDVIKLASSVTAASILSAGDGNDQIFTWAAGSGKLYGGLGDDLLMTAGGLGATTLYGQGGTDSFWFGSDDTVGDAAAAETAIGAVHRIASLYQPYTTTTTAPQYVSLTVAGQQISDPTTTSAASGYRNYSASPLFVNGANYNDINQGGIGDCYFLASLAGLADTDPQILNQAIAPMGDGTYLVRFYRSGQSVYLRVDADLPVSGASLAYADAGSGGEIWVPLLEKAFAYFRTGQNSYASINGGWMADVMTMLTNTSNSYQSTSTSADTFFNYLQTQLNAGHAVTLGSKSVTASPVVANHAYMVKSVQVTPTGKTITVYNPWGVDGRSYDSNYYDGLLTLTVAQVQASFTGAVVSMA